MGVAAGGGGGRAWAPGRPAATARGHKGARAAPPSAAASIGRLPGGGLPLVGGLERGRRRRRAGRPVPAATAVSVGRRSRRRSAAAVASQSAPMACWGLACLLWLVACQAATAIDIARFYGYGHVPGIASKRSEGELADGAGPARSQCMRLATPRMFFIFCLLIVTFFFVLTLLLIVRLIPRFDHLWENVSVLVRSCKRKNLSRPFYKCFLYLVPYV